MYEVYWKWVGHSWLGKNVMCQFFCWIDFQIIILFHTTNKQSRKHWSDYYIFFCWKGFWKSYDQLEKEIGFWLTVHSFVIFDCTFIINSWNWLKVNQVLGNVKVSRNIWWFIKKSSMISSTYKKKFDLCSYFFSVDTWGFVGTRTPFIWTAIRWWNF